MPKVFLFRPLPNLETCHLSTTVSAMETKSAMTRSGFGWAMIAWCDRRDGPLIPGTTSPWMKDFGAVHFRCCVARNVKLSVFSFRLRYPCEIMLLAQKCTFQSASVFCCLCQIERRSVRKCTRRNSGVLLLMP